MNSTILAAIALAAVVLTAAVVLISKQRKINKRPVAAGRGPIRFSRESLEPQGGYAKKKKAASSRPVGTLAVYAVGAVLLIWVGLSLANRHKDPIQPVVQAAAEAFPLASEGLPEPSYSASLSGRLQPPPQPGEAASSATAPPSAHVVAQAGTLPPTNSILASPTASAGQALANNLTLPKTSSPFNFAPFEPGVVPDSQNMVVGAQAMAPDLSRMEPVGRKLIPPPDESDPNAPAPPLVRQPPQPRPRLTAPVNQPAPQSDPLPPSQKRKYTVLLGSFAKPENATLLRDKLLEAGYPVIISEVTIKNKVWFRVMSGNFDDKVSAEAYGRDLKQRNLVDNPYIKPM